MRLGKAPEDGHSLKLAESQNEWITTTMNSGQLNFINLDINKISGFVFSHGAWYENPWVSSDIIVTLNSELSPEQRGLDKYKGKLGRDVWYFPQDYLEKLKEILLERIEKNKK